MSALKRVAQHQLSNMRNTCRAAWILTEKVMIKIVQEGIGKWRPWKIMHLDKITEWAPLCPWVKIQFIIHSFICDSNGLQETQSRHTVKPSTSLFWSSNLTWTRLYEVEPDLYLVVGSFWHFDIQRARQDSIPAGAYVSLSKHCGQ